MIHAHHPFRGRPVAVLLVALTLAVGCSTTVDGRGTVDAAAAATGTSAPVPDDPTTGADPTGSTGGDPTSGPDSHERWLPTEENPDPSVDIDGIYVGEPELYARRYHFEAPTRVAYDRYPPVGGPHDPTWAACDGVVYDAAVRDEMMVHALEHGAVWIAYDPDTLPADELSALRALVPQVGYLVMTPYPGLSTPLSLQSWGHQLALDSSTDPRFEHFLLALLRNPYVTPEINATCANATFDVADPPPFVADPPGADAIPLDWTPPTSTGATTESPGTR